MGEIDAFLGKLAADDPVKHAIITRLREIVARHHPEAEERFMYGGITVRAGAPVGGFFAYAAHVSVEFSRGRELADPAGVLEGSGKFRRHIKLRGVEDIAAKQVEDYLRRAFRLPAV